MANAGGKDITRAFKRVFDSSLRVTMYSSRPFYHRAFVAPSGEVWSGAEN